MTDKQEWVYTEEGAKLEKSSTTVTVGPKVNKWYFAVPWIIWLIVIIYFFWLGGNWAAMGFLLIVFGPVPITLLNIKTFKKIYMKPLKSKK